MKVAAPMPLDVLFWLMIQGKNYLQKDSCLWKNVYKVFGEKADYKTERGLRRFQTLIMIIFEEKIPQL